MSQANYENISPTAFLTCLARQLTDLPMAREMSDLVADRRLFALPLVLELRYKGIDALLRRERPGQILELAAGFLTRGLDWSADPELLYLETDLPEVLEAKREAVQRLVGERPNLRFLSADATLPLTELNTLLRPGPVAVVCEGFLVYLEREEKARVCRNVAELLARRGGCWITPDFGSTAGMKHRVLPEPVRRRMQMLTDSTGRSMAECSFDSLEEARDFCSQWFTVEHPPHGLSREEMSCLSRITLPDVVVGGILADPGQAPFLLRPKGGAGTVDGGCTSP